MSKTINSFNVVDFQKMFNMTEGEFDTNSTKTHGKMTLTAGGKLRNIGRYDSGIIDYSGREKTGRLAKENYRVRYALVQALKNAHMNKQWIEDLKLGVGVDDAYNGTMKARPLSRRTIKNILCQCMAQNPNEIQPETNRDIASKGPVNDESQSGQSVADLDDTVRNAALASEDTLIEGTLNGAEVAQPKTAVVKLMAIVDYVEVGLKKKNVNKLTSNDASAIISHLTTKKSLFEKLLNRVNDQQAVGMIKGLQKMYQREPVKSALYAAILEKLPDVALVKRDSDDSVKEAVEKREAEKTEKKVEVTKAKVKIPEKSDDCGKILEALNDVEFDEVDHTLTDLSLRTNAMKISQALMRKKIVSLAPEQAKFIISHLVNEKTSFGQVLLGSKNNHGDYNFVKKAQKNSTSPLFGALLGAIGEYLNEK